MSQQAASQELSNNAENSAQSLAMSNYSQKLVEQKEREVQEIIWSKYGRVKELEKELSQLQLQLKITAGPKKHALELLRKKIETQNEKVAAIKQRYKAAKQVFEAVEAELQREEAVKDHLCSELNLVVQQSATAELNKLEELKHQLLTLQGFAPPVPGTATAVQPAAAEVSSVASVPAPQQPSTTPAAAAAPSPEVAAGADDNDNPFRSQPAGPTKPGPSQGGARGSRRTGSNPTKSVPPRQVTAAAAPAPAQYSQQQASHSEATSKAGFKGFDT